MQLLSMFMHDPEFNQLQTMTVEELKDQTSSTLKSELAELSTTHEKQASTIL